MWQTRRALLILAAVSAFETKATVEDQRLLIIAYEAGQVTPLNIADGSTATLIFSAEEQIADLDATPSDDFVIAISSNRDSAVIQKVRQPASPEFRLRTQLREYVFRFEPTPAAKSIYVIKFSYSRIPSGAQGRYRLSGETALRPSKIRDDGIHTYLEWNENQALPAVFAVNSLGDEEIVDGYMRDGVYTIDQVNAQLVFRIGKKSAKAVRNDK